MDELNKKMLTDAQKCISKLAQGINPLSNKPVSEKDVVNNLKISVKQKQYLLRVKFSCLTWTLPW